MYCENCGKRINDDAIFCNECGAKVLPTYTHEHNNIERTNKKNRKKKYSPKHVFLWTIYVVVLFCVTFSIARFFVIRSQNGLVDHSKMTDDISIPPTVTEETKGAKQIRKEAYVSELEKLIVERCGLYDHEPRDLKLINRELSVLQEYCGYPYGDILFTNALNDYYNGLQKQKGSFDLSYVDRDIEWLSGLLLKIEALEFFYQEYTDFGGASGFEEKYLYNKELYSEHLSALREINRDLNNQLHQDNVASSNYYTMSIGYENKTKYDFDAVFYVTYFDKNDNAVESTIESINNLKAGLVRNLEFYFPYDEFGNGGCTYRINWEIKVKKFL